MNGVSVEALGFSKEEIEEKVIDRITDELMRYSDVDDEGDGYSNRSGFARNLEKKVTEAVNAAVIAIADKHILPNIESYVAQVTFQETDRWGSPKKEAISFKEYLTQRVEKYLTEKVDYQGKSEAEGRDDYSRWSGTQTRVAHMINEHLHYTIKKVMEEAVKGVNAQISEGLATAAKMKLEEISKDLKFTVGTK